MSIITTTHHIKVAQDYKKNGGVIEDTNISLEIDTLRVYPASVKLAILYMTADKGFFGDLESFYDFTNDFLMRDINIMEFVRKHNMRINKQASFWDIMKYALAGEKPVENIPPFSRCPRCNALVWEKTERAYDKTEKELEPENEAYYRRCLEAYSADPRPLYCKICGQRFKMSSTSLMYKGEAMQTGISHTLKLMSSAQPTFEEVMK